MIEQISFIEVLVLKIRDFPQLWDQVALNFDKENRLKPDRECHTIESVSQFSSVGRNRHS